MFRNSNKINIINILIFVSFIVESNQEQREIKSGLYPSIFTLLNQNSLLFDNNGYTIFDNLSKLVKKFLEYPFVVI